MGAGASAAMQAMLKAILAYLLRYFLNHAGEVVDSVLGRNEKSMKWLLADFAEKAKNDAALLTELKPHVYAVVTGVAEDRLQVKLDPNDPFSPASLTAAISGKIGIPLTNITDKEALKADVLRFGATYAAAKTGIQLDPVDPFSKRSLTLAVSAASGVPLSDITDKEKTKKEIQDFARAAVLEDIQQRVDTHITQAVRTGAVRQVTNVMQAAVDAQEMIKLPGKQMTLAAARGLVNNVIQQEISAYEMKACLWSKELARKGAQVMASRLYRERMKQAGFSKKWTRGGSIKGE